MLNINIVTEDYVCEMSKLTKKHADSSFGDFGEFIYFSPKNSSHGPRIKFYGGTKETSKTMNAPTMTFDHDGNTSLGSLGNLNRKNCPNAFDTKYINKVSEFIHKALPILLLVWYDKLDESDALNFFEGQYSYEETIGSCYDIDDYILKQMLQTDNLNDLHLVCKKYNVYK